MPKILQNARETILKEGYILLEEKGYNNFSMRELANRCEIGLGTVYNYFENKMSLVMEIFNNTWTEVIEESRNIKEKDIKLEEKIKSIYKNLEKFLKYHKEVFYHITKEEKMVKENKADSDKCKKYDVIEELYVIVDEIIEVHKENKDITINMETRKLTSFLISNMITLSMKKTEYTIDDFLYILVNKL